MNEYIDADKLKGEIMRRIKELEKTFPNTYYEGEVCGLKRLLSFINSLQQEQPEVDLDAEIAIYLNSEDFTTMEAGELACHFYKLGLNARN